MKRHCVLGFVLSISVLALSMGCGPEPFAAEEARSNQIEPTSTTVHGERVLLFMEYPRLIRGEPATFLAHLSVRATGEPVRSGGVILEAGPTTLSVEAPKREGLFLPEGRFPEPGRFLARLVVKSEQVEEALDLGEIVVHATEAEARAAAEAESREELANTVPFLMEQQWKVRLLLADAEPRRMSRRLVVPARAVTPEGMSAIVSPPVAGRLLAPPSSVLPRSGTRVEEGQVLFLVEPALGAAELGQLRALDLEFDLRVLDVLRTLGESEARLQFAEREHERIGKLRAEGLSTQQQVDQAEQDLAVARSHVEAANRTKASLDQLLANRSSAGNGSFAGVRQFPASAPIAGIVVEAPHVPGEAVEPEDELFRIVDASRVWIEGRVSEFDVPLIRAESKATVTFTALPDERFELLATPGAPRAYIGQEVDTTSHTLLIRYEMQHPSDSIRSGMLAELEIATGEVDASVTIPLDALVMDQGTPTAYVMLEGELFQKRELELGIEDGGFVEVRRGIEPGERVVTRGAYIVKLVALSPASFGAGHQH